MEVFHLIDEGKYADAKEIVEEIVISDESSEWARAWYARGLLSQKAYVEGKKQNDRKKYELYPNQLYVAISSYERARIFDNRNRLKRQLAPHYIVLSNEFKKAGEKHFKEGKYTEALRAFEQALVIEQSAVLLLPKNKDIVYNAALAAYESNNYKKATEHLNWLDDQNYGPNVSHLLFTLHLENEDTEAAEKVLMEGIDKYDNNNENLVLLLVDLLYEKNEIEESIAILDQAATENPEEYKYLFTKGLIYQKTEQYTQAIDAYQTALEIAPNELLIPINIATCYYNLGVSIEEQTRQLDSNREVLEKRAQSAAAFDTSTQWLDKVYEKQPEDSEVTQKLYQLYRILNNNEKARSIQKQFDY